MNEPSMQFTVSFNIESTPRTPDLPLAEHPGRDMGTYPVLTLPPEIVGEIFENFLPNYPEQPPHVGIFSPLMLCRICTTWRQIALSTPALWRAIRIELREHESHEAMAWKLNLLNTWLSRSGDCSLSICLRYHLQKSFGSPTGFSTYPSLSQFVHAIVRHCRRWEYLNLVMPFEDISIIQGDTPQLQDLIFGPSDLPADDEPTTWQLFDHAPQLTTVVLTDCFVPAVMHLPWSQLTSLEGLCLYEHESTEILSQATNLVHSTMTVCGPPEPDIPIPEVPVHSHLRELILLVTEASDVDLADILDMLTLPALRTLQFPEPYVSMLGPLETLKGFISRSQCTLDELRVVEASLPEPLYRAALPSVRSITLHGPEEGVAFDIL
ncbi:hypothetical protein B0H19DRAFT_1103750 [Mycena capillaripes]|nr:hypothetical protein B0H19DRAFT_1103750 [Mycena capillaripes]